MHDLISSYSIAMITDDFVPGGTGVGVHVQKLSREMVARGHRVIVITTRRRGQPPEEMWEGVKVYRVFSIPLYGFYQALPSLHTLRHIFLQNSVGIVHCHYLGIMMLRALKVSKAMGIPTVLTTHMSAHLLTQPIYMRPWRPLISNLIARVYEKFGDIICVSQEYAKQVGRFSIASRVCFISNPVEFVGTESKIHQSADCFRIFFAGRLTPDKNVGLLLRAFKIVLAQNPSAELWIAGQGVLEKELKALAESLGVKNQVKFLGHVAYDKLPDLYAACNVFVLPSFVETQGLVALEAMRFRRPVIVTNRIMSAKELIDEGKNGFIVDAYAADELAERLNRLWQDPLLRQKQGEAGFAKSSIYTISAVGDDLEGVYKTIALSLPSKGSDPHVDKRHRCVFCQIGTFERRREHVIVAADAQKFQEEYFAIWRCAFCHSMHSLTKFSLEEYYRQSPFLKRRLNRYNRVAFEGFHHWLQAQGIQPYQKILFYGVNALMFQAFFKEKGFCYFDAFEEVMNEVVLTQPPGAYDVVIILDYLERAEDPANVIEFAKRQLVPGGKLIVHTPDADKISMPLTPTHQMHQPYRIHIASWSALEHLALANDFKKVSMERRHYLDTLVPFINFKAFHDLAFFLDGSMEAGFNFRPKDVFRKPWRFPHFLALGLFGGFVRDQSNVLAVFNKKT